MPRSRRQKGKRKVGQGRVRPPRVRVLVPITTRDTITFEFTLSSTMPRTFGELKKEVEDRLDPKSYDPDEAQKALNSLQIAYPLPPTEIVDPDIWHSDYPVLRFNTHFKSDVRDAIRNITFASHAFGPSDYHWLQLIHTHWCGWSATTPQHRGDGWV